MNTAEWRCHADDVIAAFAARGEPFTSDDLLEAIGPPDTEHTPNAANNAIGAAFRRAASEGLIKTVGHTQSKAPHRKGGLIRIWQGVGR